MKLVSTWLNGIGLSSAIPTFEAAGIVTPAALAELEVSHFEALGISDADDRRKLFYLVQRIKMAVKKDEAKQDTSVEEQVDAVLGSAISLAGASEKKEDSNAPLQRETKRRSKRLATQQQSSSPSTAKENRLNGYPRMTRRTERLTIDENNEEDGDDSAWEEPVEEVTLPAKPATRRQAAKKSGLKPPNHSSASSSLSDSRSVGETKATKSTTSRMQAPKARRPESKLQNPGISKRSGKRLSTIPSESAAPTPPPVDYSRSKVRDGNETRPKTKNSKKSLNHRRRNSDESLEDLLQSSMSDTSQTESDEESSTQLPVRNSKSSNGRRLGTARPSLNGSKRRSLLGRSDNSLKSTANSSTAQMESESWAAKVQYLREDNNAEHELFRDEANDQLFDYDMRIRVVVRKRPMSKSEVKLSGGIDVIHPLDYGDYGRTLVYQPKTRVDLTKEIETIPFAFDNVFDEKSTNVQIYERSLRNLIAPFFKGQWATVFAYGQTGSGKTYTMMGSNMTGIKAGTATSDAANFGLYYLAALEIFELAKNPEYKHLSVQVSLFEIYGGKLFDLLNGRKQIKCLEDSKGNVCFPGLTEHPAQQPDHVMKLIEEGAQNRSTGTTSRNADSSRSHAVLQLKLRKDVGRKKNVEHGTDLRFPSYSFT